MNYCDIYIIYYELLPNVWRPTRYSDILFSYEAAQANLENCKEMFPAMKYQIVKLTPTVQNNAKEESLQRIITI